MQRQGQILTPRCPWRTLTQEYQGNGQGIHPNRNKDQQSNKKVRRLGCQGNTLKRNRFLKSARKGASVGQELYTFSQCPRRTKYHSQRICFKEIQWIRKCPHHTFCATVEEFLQFAQNLPCSNQESTVDIAPWEKESQMLLVPNHASTSISFPGGL